MTGVGGEVGAAAGAASQAMWPSCGGVVTAASSTGIDGTLTGAASGGGAAAAPSTLNGSFIGAACSSSAPCTVEAV